MLQVFEKAVQQHRMLDENDAVCVALSGGADSVCLLLNLIEYREKLPLDLVALHVHHGIRGEEADRDARFCKELCERLSIPFVLKQVDAPGYAKEQGLSLETAARELRYQALEAYPCDKIATAHTLDDQGETVLLNLTRGTGLKGLCGIPPVRGRIVRPMLFASRREIEEYLSACGQSFVTDTTNFSCDYSRNRIRKEVVPQLQLLNPSWEQTVQRTIEILREEEDFLQRESEKALQKALLPEGLSLGKLAELHSAMRSRCIKLFLEQNGFSVSADTVRRACALTDGGKINLSKNVYLKAKRGILSIVEECAPFPDFCVSAVPGVYSFCGKTAELKIISMAEYREIANVHKNFTIYGADYGKIQGNVVLRNRRPGDRIQLPGRDFHTSVKKLFSEKVPVNQRSARFLLEDRSGVIFAEGFGFAESVKISPKTERVFCIVIENRGERP